MTARNAPSLVKLVVGQKHLQSFGHYISINHS